MKDPDILGVFSVMGFSFSGAAPNQGIMFASLKPFDERPGAQHSSGAVLGRVMPQLLSIPGAIVVSFSPPAIPGLSRFGGFEFNVLDQTGTDINTLARGAVAVIARREQVAAAAKRGVHLLHGERPAAGRDASIASGRMASGVRAPEITSALQTFLGSSYVNDFQFNNRAYRVYVQADQQFRSSPQNLKQLYARSKNGQMVPLESVLTMKETTAPQVISHFNLFRSATLNGSAAPGVSSGDALKEMERIATRACRRA